MKINLDQAVDLLQSWKLVWFPTETVYGLGALVNNSEAVEQVYQIKHRPSDNPLICHFASASQIKEYTTNLPAYRDILVSHFSPGAVSYLLYCKDERLRPATRWSDKVLCRIPSHPLALQLLEQLDGPVVWPSANPSGQPSATNVDMIEHYFGADFAVLDGWSSIIGLESTIIDCTMSDIVTILRPWQVWVTEIQNALERGGYEIPVHLIQEIDNEMTPGSKYRHYSPHTIIYKISTRDPIHERGDIAIIWPTELLQWLKTTEVLHRINLGSIYMPSTIAHNLYRKLHELDSLWVRHAYLLTWQLGTSSIEQALAHRFKKIGEDKQD